MLRLKVIFIIYLFFSVQCFGKAINSELSETVQVFKHLQQSIVVTSSNIPGTNIIMNGIAFCIDTEGYYLTCAHLLCNTRTWNSQPELYISFRDDKYSGIKFKAQILSVDSIYDIAIIKTIDYQPGQIQPLSFDTTEKYEIGDIACFCGTYPRDAGIYFRQGIINSYFSFYPLDTSISKIINGFTLDVNSDFGSSGSPIILAKNGKVIGITNKIIQEGNTPFPIVIPIKYCIPMCNSISQRRLNEMVK